jgi:hypothetical protein
VRPRLLAVPRGGAEQGGELRSQLGLACSAPGWLGPLSCNADKDAPRHIDCRSGSNANFSAARYHVGKARTDNGAARDSGEQERLIFPEGGPKPRDFSSRARATSGLLLISRFWIRVPGGSLPISTKPPFGGFLHLLSHPVAADFSGNQLIRRNYLYPALSQGQRRGGSVCGWSMALA